MVTGGLIVLICPVISMVFFTLLEQKLIGYSQLRVGPNKVSLAGVLQPVLDAVKLFSKGHIFLMKGNRLAHMFFPVWGLMLALIMWGLYPNNWWCSSFVLVIFLCVSGLSVYSVVGGGWSSNSKYAMLGATRAIAQTISYEVSMALLLMGGVMFFNGWEFEMISAWPCIMVSPLLVVWFLSCLAETNRSPFDFVEGESEIVSGFNIEYSASGFVMIFMSEYLMMLFLSALSYIIFTPHFSFCGVGAGVFCFLFVWVRASLPRLRYDVLMNLCWKMLLPISLLFFFLFFLMCRL